MLPVKDRNVPQKCDCGGEMARLMSVPLPAIFVTTNRDNLVDTLNGDGNAYTPPGGGRHRQRYENMIGNSLFNQEKPVIGRGF